MTAPRPRLLQIPLLRARDAERQRNALSVHARYEVIEALKGLCLMWWGKRPCRYYVPDGYTTGPARVWCEMKDGRRFYGMADTYPVGQDDWYWDVSMCRESGCQGRQDERLCHRRCGRSVPM